MPFIQTQDSKDSKARCGRREHRRFRSAAADGSRPVTDRPPVQSSQTLHAWHMNPYIGMVDSGVNGAVMVPNSDRGSAWDLIGGTARPQ